jgi:hypothetical protein
MSTVMSVARYEVYKVGAQHTVRGFLCQRTESSEQRLRGYL